MSHLLQMRGLKPGEKIIESMNVKSHLLQMRGLKLVFKQSPNLTMRRIFYRCVD